MATYSQNRPWNQWIGHWNGFHGGPGATNEWQGWGRSPMVNTNGGWNPWSDSSICYNPRQPMAAAEIPSMMRAPMQSFNNPSKSHVRTRIVPPSPASSYGSAAESCSLSLSPPQSPLSTPAPTPMRSSAVITDPLVSPSMSPFVQLAEQLVRINGAPSPTPIQQTRTACHPRRIRFETHSGKSSADSSTDSGVHSGTSGKSSADSTKEEDPEELLRREIMGDRKSRPKPRSDYVCHNCGEAGDHLVWDCPKRETYRKAGIAVTPYQGNNDCVGLYKCPKCKRQWTSIKSGRNKIEVCKNCKTTVHAWRQVPSIKVAEDLGIFFKQQKRTLRQHLQRFENTFRTIAMKQVDEAKDEADLNEIRRSMANIRIDGTSTWAN